MEEENSPLKDHPTFYSDLEWTPFSLGRACSFLMMPFIFGIIGLTYVPYIDLFGDGSFGGSLCLAVFHVLLLLMLTSYFQVVFTDAGTIPAQWDAKVASTAKPAYKKCRYTNKYRPLRSHYCGITRRVVLNLDHFCPWVANTVGFKNRKFFVLFCFYSMLTCAFAAVTLGPYAVSAAGDRTNTTINKALGLMALIMDATFAVALGMFAIGHFYMARYNMTSLEDGKESKRYDVGWHTNMCSVFGRNPRLWFVPFHGKSGLFGDGVHWKISDGTWDGFADKVSAEDNTTV